ncbi:MAG: hypothetical protein NTX64_03995 [Elusimicrobia bacterium]|nr:hypothetical protein [Elusimicrobiota bacterium]
MLRAFLLLALAASPATAQLDPEKRQLIQLGADKPLEGGPAIGYGFYYLNRPHLYMEDLTLRLVVAPVYMDSELGLRRIAPSTDLGIDLAGGGFAYGHNEIRHGTYVRGESFNGDGFSFGFSVYHVLNPLQRIPLCLVVRPLTTLQAFQSRSTTDPNFQAPLDFQQNSLRLGIRFGGREPELGASGLELSAWYEGQFRNRGQQYGFDGDRTLRQRSQLFWTRANFSYTFPATGRYLYAGLTLGTSADTDRLNAWKLGGQLPFTSEFPLAIPGYIQDEIAARSFEHFEARWLTPLDRARRVGFGVWGVAAVVDYLPGFEQNGSLNSGLGAWGQLDGAKRNWRLGLLYGYGVTAVRSPGRGAHSVGLTVQFNIGPATWPLPFEPEAPVERPRGALNPGVLSPLTPGKLIP